MDIIIMGEESQEICKAFRARGHNAFSCDLQDCIFPFLTCIDVTEYGKMCG